MKSLRKWLLILGMGGSTLLGTNCGTQVRDALASSALNYLSQATTNLLETTLPLEDPNNGG